MYGLNFKAATARSGRGAGVRFTPTNNQIAFAGDSRTAQAFDNATGRFYLESHGAPAWAVPATGHRFKIASPNQYGVGGDTSADLLARWAAVLADPAGSIALLISTNDRGSANMTLAQTIANVTPMITQAATVGKAIFLCNETPRFDANALTGQQLQNHLDFRDWCTTTAPNLFNNVRPVDTWNAITGTADFRDGLHQNTAGARKTGAALATTINAVLPAVDLSRPYTSGEVTATPILNLNPDMTGIGGTKGGGSTGDLADNWTTTLSSGVLAALSKETVNGVVYQVVTFSGTAPAGTPSFTLRPTANLTLAAGEAYDMRARVKLDPGATNMLAVSPEARIDGTLLQQSKALDGYIAPDNVPAGGFDLLLCTPPATVPASGVTTIRGQIVVQFAPASTVSGTIRIAQAGSRRVTG